LGFTQLILASIGFSIGAALLLTLALATIYKAIALPVQSRFAGSVMLIGLALTQFFHAQFLLANIGLANGIQSSAALVDRAYVLVLLFQSIGFYWLLLGLLRPVQQRWDHWEWAVLPLAVLMIAALPVNIALPIVMVFGVAFAAHLAVLVYRLRAQRRWFLLEFRVLALFGVMAVLVSIASLVAPLIGWLNFAAIYSALIAISFAIVLYLLLRFPDITSKTEEAVASTYTVSTLNGVDCDQVVAQIKHLFEQEKIYTDENLSLNKLAELTQLSAHQLSELINTEFEMGFSRLVRHYRVEAAKVMLIDEPRASVLSVGLSVGFTSQSNFYVAFKEFTDIVPGQFRKQMAAISKEKTPPLPK
jgi:AraC-like DNA-binding protein